LRPDCHMSPSAEGAWRAWQSGVAGEGPLIVRRSGDRRRAQPDFGHPIDRTSEQHAASPSQTMATKNRQCHQGRVPGAQGLKVSELAMASPRVQPDSGHAFINVSMAEAVGFEPTMPSRACLISSQVQSTTLPCLHGIRRTWLRSRFEQRSASIPADSPALETRAIRRCAATPSAPIIGPCAPAARSHRRFRAAGRGCRPGGRAGFSACAPTPARRRP
jgi:hypothetical protein